MDILREIADSIEQNIQFTTDIPNNHTDAKMPVLDLKVWMDVRDTYPQILHTFYKKEVASKYTILERSAMSKGTKRSTLFQEALRRLQNVSPALPFSEAIPHMDEFSNMLRISGYSSQYRYNVMKGAIERMKEVRRKVASGEWKSQYRDRASILAAKIAKGGSSASTWFLKGEVTSTLTVTATPGSELQKAVRKALEKAPQADGGKTMVLEDGGVPAHLGLKSRDPFRVEKCRFKDDNCRVDPATDCSQQGRVYILTCNACPEAVEGATSKGRPTEPGGETRKNYVGMTGTSMHARSLAHSASVKYGTLNNAMAKHMCEDHRGQDMGFTMKPMSTHRTVLSRYKTEGVVIEKQASNTSLNSKIEGGRGGLVRLRCQIDRC